MQINFLLSHSKRFIILCLTIIFLLAPIAFSQSANWVQITPKQNWQQTSIGTCTQTNQCLVRNSFNENITIWSAYWDGLFDPSLGPKCIDSGKYILDNYCEMGNWSSRTKLLATQLLATALAESPTKFTLACDNAQTILNNYAPFAQILSANCPQNGLFVQRVTIEPCVNSVCVLVYGNKLAWGTSLNSPIDSPTSILIGFNTTTNYCTNAINNDNKYDLCGDGKLGIWYNHDTETIIHAPQSLQLSPPTPQTQDYFNTPYLKLKNYVFTVVHKPTNFQTNYTFFATTPQFSHVYLAKNGYHFAYAFAQNNVTLNQINYAGLYYSNIQLGNDPCRIVKLFDRFAHCENQPNPNEFYLVAHNTPPLGTISPPSIVDSFSDISSKLRVTP